MVTRKKQKSTVKKSQRKTAVADLEDPAEVAEAVLDDEESAADGKSGGVNGDGEQLEEINPSDPAVRARLAEGMIKALIDKGKKKGYLTYEEMNEELPDGRSRRIGWTAC